MAVSDAIPKAAIARAERDANGLSHGGFRIRPG